MKKKEVNICDICEKVVSKSKCEICERDVCEDCHKTTNINIVDKALATITICESCEIALDKALNKPGLELLGEQIAPSIIAGLKKMVMLEDVSKKEIKEKIADKKRIKKLMENIKNWPGPSPTPGWKKPWYTFKSWVVGKRTITMVNINTDERRNT